MPLSRDVPLSEQLRSDDQATAPKRSATRAALFQDAEQPDEYIDFDVPQVICAAWASGCICIFSAAARGAQLNVRRADALCSALEHLYFGIALALNLNPPWVGLKAGFYCAGLNPGLALGPLLVGLNPGLNRGAFSGAERVGDLAGIEGTCE